MKTSTNESETANTDRLGENSGGLVFPYTFFINFVIKLIKPLNSVLQFVIMGNIRYQKYQQKKGNKQYFKFFRNRGGKNGYKKEKPKDNVTINVQVSHAAKIQFGTYDNFSNFPSQNSYPLRELLLPTLPASSDI